MRSQLKNQKNIRYKTHLGTVEDIELLDSGETLYTGEKIDKYSEQKSLRVVPLNKMGKVYNEQMGLIYDYVYTLQHTGEPILNEGTLVWLRNSTSQNPDFIVRGVVTSLNSTIYHLIKKEV